MEPIRSLGHAPRCATRAGRSLTVAVLIVLGALLAATRLPASSARAQGDACVTSQERTVFPRQVELGQTVDVTMRFRASCPDQASPFHLVFVVDGSGSMAGQRLERVRAVLGDLIEALELPAHPGTQIGLVSFSDAPSTLCQLTNDSDRLTACLLGLGASGGGATDLGILEGIEVLRQGRDPEPGPSAVEVLLLLTDGANLEGCEPVEVAARQAKSQGILLLTICLSEVCDRACMRGVASSARYFLPDLDAAILTDLCLRVRDTAASTTPLTQIVVTDRVPPNLRYVEGSAQPSAGWDPGTRTLTWRRSRLPAEGLTYTFAIEPLELGTHPSSLEARLRYVDGHNVPGGVDFPIEDLSVIAGAPTPTPQPQPALLGGLDVDAPRLDIGQHAGLSYALDFALPEPPADTHLALVLDESGSMAGASMEKLVEGAGRMLDRLAPIVPAGRFAGAVVAFKSSARSICPLTGSFPMLRACVARLSAAGGTAIDAGLDEGLSMLAAGRPWDGGEDLVLFSDGANNQGCPPVLAAADRVKAEGVVLHAVCLGAACDEVCLQAAASSPRHYFKVDQAADLPDAFAGIAEDLIARRGVESVELGLRLPDHLRLLPGSFSIPPDRQDEAAASWSLSRLPAGGLRLDFEVEALEAGVGTVVIEARVARLGDTTLHDLRRSPPIEVPGLATPPTPTGVAPGETPAATPTDRQPPPRATPPPGTLYLPLLLSESCPSGPTDLVLVVDGSLSMGERFGAQGSKLDAAREGARSLIARLGPNLRVALVAFDVEARLLEPFTPDAAALGAALDRIELRSGSAIDAGIDRAREALLASDRRDAVDGLIVLISDGRALESDAEAAIAAANRARAYKLEIHVVGLGREVDAPTLRAVAGSPERYRRVEDAAGALAVLDQLGRDIACPVPGRWGGR